MHEHRHGAKQPRPFDPARASRLDDPARFEYVPPADLIALLDVPPDGTLVDYGTGTGTYAVGIARARPDVHLYALDENDAMLGATTAKIVRSGLTNIVAVGPSACVALAGRVDRVLALNVLHELGDAALDDLRGLLAPRAWALFVDWNADVERPHGPPNDHVYGVAAARRRLEERGFIVEAAGAFPFHHAFTGRDAASARDAR